MGDEDNNQNIAMSPMSIGESPLRKDIVGDAAEFVDNFIQAAESEGIYKVMGTSTDKSFLITGAPGNGKTIAIEALVNEMNQGANIEHPPQKLKLLGFEYDTGVYGTKWINEGSKIAQTFFNTCFSLAKQGYKTMVVFDEAETIFGKRLSEGSHKEDAKVLETIMKNMQRLHNTDNMYAVMMSNFPEAFDEASIRSGRVDKRYEFKNPTSEERVFAYEHAINNINGKAGYEVVKGCDPEYLSTLSKDFSYSDIVESISSAVKLKAKEVSSQPQNGSINLGVWVEEKRVIDAITNHKKMFVKTPTARKIGFM